MLGIERIILSDMHGKTTIKILNACLSSTTTLTTGILDGVTVQKDGS
jgi:hypothetical protein